ncbi:MAG: ATP-binding cassette domain-containing protein, partial [Phycicoccus sp.]
RGAVFLGGVDVRDLDLQRLRAAVGVVTQRTEILAGTLAENIALFAELPRERVESAVAELGLTEWVAGLPAGLDTSLGPGGTPLSAGEEQLVAFARLLVRDVVVVVLDEATARMDPLTEALVVHAADRLLVGRTGLLVAHRLSTTARADLVAVLDRGRVLQHGRRAELAAEPGPFRRLLAASGTEASRPGAPVPGPASADERSPEDRPRTDGSPGRSGAAEPETPGGEPTAVSGSVTGARRTGPPPPLPDPGDGPSLARGILSALVVRPRWGVWPALLFLVSALVGAFGAVTGYLWGGVVEQLQAGAGWNARTVILTALTAVSVFVAPLLLTAAIRRYPRWWIEVMLRVRMTVLLGQTRQHRLARTPPGEVVARSM